MAEEKSKRIVRTFAKLVPEPERSKELSTLLKESTAGRPNKPDEDGYCLIWFNVSQSGESASSPQLRRVALNLPNLKKMINGVQLSRENPDAIDTGDMYGFADGGKHGLEGSLTSSIADTEGNAMNK